MSELTHDKIAEIAANAAVKALNQQQKNDPASTTLTAQTLHGPTIAGSSTTQYGLFADPGVRPDMFSTFVRPRTLMSLVSFQRSRNTNELIDTFTGLDGVSGTNATGFCADPPNLAGEGYKGKRKFLFGDFFGKTELVPGPLNGQVRDYADLPRNILNVPPEQRNPFIPDLMYRLNDPDLQMGQVAYNLWRFGSQMERVTEFVMVQGTTGGASTTDGLGWFNQFDGLDAQIKTGYQDSATSVAAPALDSIVVDFGASVGDTIPGGDGRNIVQTLSDVVWALGQRAQDMGMTGVQWAIAMRRELFRSLTEVYSCNYATYRCSDSGSAGTPIEQSAIDVNRLRLDMQNGQYLLVDGVQVPVVFSEGIEQTRNATAVYESDMYIVPLSWMGMPLLRYEYFPMDNAANNMLRQMGGYDFQTLNNGMFYASNRNNGNCVELLFSHRGRLILETPWLAGRIDDLQYTFRADIRNAYPSDTVLGPQVGGVTYTS